MSDTLSIANKRLTQNFWLHEFLVSDVAARAGIDNLPDETQLANLQIVAVHLQAERDYLTTVFDEVIRFHITSGFRCAELNAHPEVKGSPTSDHCKGLAVDRWHQRVSGGHLDPVSVINAMEMGGREFDQYIYYPDQARIHSGYGARMRHQVLTKMPRGSYHSGLLAVGA